MTGFIFISSMEVVNYPPVNLLKINGNTYSFINICSFIRWYKNIHNLLITSQGIKWQCLYGRINVIFIKLFNITDIVFEFVLYCLFYGFNLKHIDHLSEWLQLKVYFLTRRVIWKENWIICFHHVDGNTSNTSRNVLENMSTYYW